LRIEWASGGSELSAGGDNALDSTLEISDGMDASMGEFDFAQTASAEVIQRQTLLQDLPVEFSATARLDELLRTVVKRAVEIVPGAERGTLLLYEPKTDELSLGAFVSDGEPAVSETLARRALKEQKAFIWHRGFEGDPAMSVRHLRIESGMYAPLLRQSRTVGVICVDNPTRHSTFRDDDLRLLLAIAHEAAIAVASCQFLLTFSCRSVRVLPV
jgi:GAF domain-containing protein